MERSEEDKNALPIWFSKFDSLFEFLKTIFPFKIICQWTLIMIDLPALYELKNATIIKIFLNKKDNILLMTLNFAVKSKERSESTKPIKKI